MKGEISKNAVTVLVVLLVLISAIGAGVVLIGANSEASIALIDKDSGTVGLNVGTPPEPTTTTGQVGLIVSS